MQIIETQRLILRRPVLDDLEDYVTLYSDAEITRYIPDAPKNYTETREEVEWFLHGHPKFPELGLWATIYKETGQFIGRCGLLPWTIEGQQEVEVAYTISRQFWGQGLGTEAAKAILDYGFDRLHQPRLVSLIDPHNLASQRVAEKIGMTLERKFEGWNGDGIPFWVYSITRNSPESE